MDRDSNWRAKALLIGAVIGGLAGVAGAYLLVRRAEARGTKPKLEPAEGIRIGLLVMGLLRQVAQLGDGKSVDE